MGRGSTGTSPVHVDIRGNQLSIRAPGTWWQHYLGAYRNVFVSARKRTITLTPIDDTDTADATLAECASENADAEPELALVINTLGADRLMAAARRAQRGAAAHARTHHGSLVLTLPGPWYALSQRRLRNAAMVAIPVFTALLGYKVGLSMAAGSPQPVKVGQLVKSASHGQAKAQQTFSGPDGLRGVVLQGTGQTHNSTVGWVVPGARPLLVIGDVMDASGHEYTAAASQKYRLTQTVAKAALNSTAPTRTTPQTSAPQTPAPLSKPALFKALATQAHSIQSGSGQHTVYVFIDPNCPYCHELFQTVRKARSKLNHLGVHIAWVPTAVIKQSSIGKAAAVLKGGLPALVDDETHFNVGGESGGIKPIKAKRWIRQVRDNTVLLDRDGRTSAVPTLVWRDGSGAVHIKVGVIGRQKLVKLAHAIATNGADHG